MKYALFEFVAEKSCEVGETRWILHEDSVTFDNDSWESGKEVLVEWPRAFVKMSKKILKSSIDPDSVETISCVAKVLKFSDDYEDIRNYMRTYCETGSTSTPRPHRGRGQRVSKKNARYHESEDEEPAGTEKSFKRQKKLVSALPDPAKNGELEKLKAKYNITEIKAGESEGTDDEIELYSSDDEDKVVLLKKQNIILQKKLTKKEQEIKHLHDYINNLKHMPSLQNVVCDLKAQVEQLRGEVNSPKRVTTVLSNATSSSSSCPSPMSTSSNSSSESSVEGELITLCPNVKIGKKQFQMIKTKSTPKEFVYPIMAMLWSREVLFTHSITGKASNAYKGTEAKPQLDQEKVKSICEFASAKYGCSEADIKQIMIAKISNVVKVIKAKQRLSSECKETK